MIDFTPELKAEALEILRKFDFGPPYTPPSERGTIVKPGYSGGANWWGAAFDPKPATCTCRVGRPSRWRR